jgi:hypothetical protein
MTGVIMMLKDMNAGSSRRAIIFFLRRGSIWAN